MSAKAKAAYTFQPVSRIAAKLAHYPNVCRVRETGENRAVVYLTNTGIGIDESRTIREYGWQICGVCPRFNTVTIRKKGRWLLDKSPN